MKKATKRTLIVLAFVAGLSYFAFTLVFFDPFEGSYLDEHVGQAVALEYVVPRNVHFFAHKRGLENDFRAEDFPVPEAWERIRLSRRWQKFERTPLYEELAEELELGAKIRAIQEAAAQVPLLHPLADMAGRDLAIFGRIKGYGVDETEAAAVFLGSNMARFAFEAAGNSLVRALLGIPFEVTRDESGVRKVELEEGGALYMFRAKDLFIVGSGPQLVKEAMLLAEMGREQSLGWSRRYHSTVAQDVAEFAGAASDAPRAVENVSKRLQLHVNLPAVFSLTEGDEHFLEPREQVTRWLLARLFNPRLFDEFTLDVGFSETLDLRGMFGFDRRAAEESQTGFYNRKTFELRQAMDRVAGLVPEDTCFLMAARLDMDRFLPQLVTAFTEMDPAARQLMDELILSIRRHQPRFTHGDAMEAARHIASLLGDDVVVALKRDAYFGTGESPAPALAIFLQVKERGPTFEELTAESRDAPPAAGYNGFIFPIMQAHTRLQQEGRGVAKWYKVWHENQGSDQERFVQDVILRGTDIKNVAFGIVDPRAKGKGPWTLCVVLSQNTLEVAVGTADGGEQLEDRGTAHELITDIIKLSVTGGAPARARGALDNAVRDVRSLKESPKYRQGGGFLDGFASVAAYVDAGALKQVLTDYTAVWAAESTAIDWEQAGPAIEAELLDGEFKEWRTREMSQAVRRRFEAAVAARKEEMEQQRRMNDLPAAARQLTENLAWADLFESAFLAARIDEQSQNIEVRARIETRLDD